MLKPQSQSGIILFSDRAFASPGGSMPSEGMRVLFGSRPSPSQLLTSGVAKCTSHDFRFPVGIGSKLTLGRRTPQGGIRPQGRLDARRTCTALTRGDGLGVG